MDRPVEIAVLSKSAAASSATLRAAQVHADELGVHLAEYLGRARPTAGQHLHRWAVKPKSPMSD